MFCSVSLLFLLHLLPLFNKFNYNGAFEIDESDKNALFMRRLVDVCGYQLKPPGLDVKTEFEATVLWMAMCDTEVINSVDFTSCFADAECSRFLLLGRWCTSRKK